MKTPWVKTTTAHGKYGARVTVEDSTGYLVTVSSPCPALAWCEAWKRYDAVSDRAAMVTG